MSEPRLARRAWASARANASPVVLAIAYGVAVIALSRITDAGGLITPEGSVDLAYAIVCVAVLVLRAVMILVLPAVVAYRLARSVMMRAARSRIEE